MIMTEWTVLMDRTLKLVDRLCGCLAAASTDEEHPAVRYGRQLEELSKKLAGQGDTVSTVFEQS
jgi:hypothetical protein